MIQFLLKTDKGYESEYLNTLENATALLRQWEQDPSFHYSVGDSIQVLEVSYIEEEDISFDTLSKFIMASFCTKIEDGIYTWEIREAHELDTIFKIERVSLKDSPYLFKVQELPHIPAASHHGYYIDLDGYSKVVGIEVDFLNTNDGDFYKTNLFVKSVSDLERFLKQFWEHRLQTTKEIIPKIGNTIKGLEGSNTAFYRLFCLKPDQLNLYLDSGYEDETNAFSVELSLNNFITLLYASLSPSVLEEREYLDERQEENYHLFFKEPYYSVKVYNRSLQLSETDLATGIKFFKTKDDNTLIRLNLLFLRKHLSEFSKNSMPSVLLEFKEYALQHLVQLTSSLESEVSILEKGYSDGYILQSFSK